MSDGRRVLIQHRPTGATGRSPVSPPPFPPPVPSPPVPSGGIAGNDSTMRAQQVKQEIVRIYSEHNAAKLPDLPRIFSLNVGREEDLLNEVRQKYVPSTRAAADSAGATPSREEIRGSSASSFSSGYQEPHPLPSPSPSPLSIVQKPSIDSNRVIDNPMMSTSGNFGAKSDYRPDRVGGEEAKMEAFDMWGLRNAPIPNLPPPPLLRNDAGYFGDSLSQSVNPRALDADGKISKRPLDKSPEKETSPLCFKWVIESPLAALARNLRGDDDASDEADEDDKDDKDKDKDKEMEGTGEALQLARARAKRVQAFQNAADNAIGGAYAQPGGDTVFPLSPEDEIITSIHVTDIKGLPSTTEEVRVEGTIEVALVLRKGAPRVAAQGGSAGGMDDSSIARLVFNVSRGTASISVEEEFRAARLEAKGGCCACCFPPACLNCLCPCYMNGGFVMDYRVQHSLTSQFFALPIAPCVIDVMAHTELKKEFAAHTSKSTSQDDGMCVIPCCNPCFCCSSGCCGCTICTTCDLSEYLYAYAVEQKMDVGVDVIPQASAADPVVSGVLWHVESRSEEGVFIVIHYLSQLTNAPRTTELKLRGGSSFEDAKKFVNAILKYKAPFIHSSFDTLAPSGFRSGGRKAREDPFGPDGRLRRGMKAAADAATVPCLECCLECSYSSIYYSTFCCCFPCFGFVKPLPYGKGLCAIRRMQRKLDAKK